MGTIGGSKAGERVYGGAERGLRSIAAVSCLLVLGLMMTLAPVAGASSGKPVRLIITRVRLHHGLLLARDLHAGAHHAHAHAAIVGGSRISIAQAPWQVLVLA